MAYDEGLSIRIEEMLGDRPGITSKRMFGGIGFLLDGNMVCGVIAEDLAVRVGPAAYADALAQEHVREFDFTGRPMKGWVMVEPEAHADDEDLQAWLERGLRFADTLPAK